ncbi:MAG: protein kinase [Candidatus Sulfotelmatobacter sp.]
MSKPETWKTWEGRVVDGKFPIRRQLGSSGHSAVFLTELPGTAQKAAIKLLVTDGAEIDRQLARLRATAKLSHPHLLRVFESGRCRLDSSSFVYVVTEYAEEDLSEILPQRPLAPSEVSELLPPLLDALSYLHGKGYVHGRVKPSNVLAVGDQLKLSADSIMAIAEPSSARRRRDVYDAPETAAGIVSPAGDVWSVGVTLVAAITQNVALAEQADPGKPALPDSIPEPYRGIARECLHLDPKRRCSLAEIRARLQPAGRSVPAPLEPAKAPQRSTKSRKPIYALALVCIAVVLLAFSIFRSREKKSSEQATETPQQPASQTAPVAPAAAPAPEAAPPAKTPTSAEGAVRHQVMPDLSQSAKSTISGTIRIGVVVEVDSSGKVKAARFKSAGPSRYFAGKTLAAAQQWQFSPPQSNGEPTASTWFLEFRLRRSGVEASSQRISR